ncbi:SAM-dependent methyltransferase [Catellatospora sp. KI3]|uniref:TRM11 family SAM-dependent methyltransferase n=1 Tax=Catellatospora sp. KI3 TaxID=3041620 RepID=UPI002482AEE1|nr:SAM-dependent methyltransferase [Catellatospora sp. KI3]MDI1459423.1 SAM-dependent methyltransferase [Catellatospora sp. KI3]
MAKYALLTAPSSNRVYTQSAPDLVAAELSVFGQRALDGRLEPAETVEFAGLPYLVFETEGGPLSDDDLRILANLSSGYALFEVTGDDLFRPVGRPGLDRFDDDLITIQKYAGKTNEHFTKLLLNVTVLATSWADQLLTRRFTVLDPVAGRGTTLNQALMYGWDAVGIELDGKDVEAYSAFLKTWLKRKRIKHTAETTPLRREGKRLGRRFDARIGDVREQPQHVALLEADTTSTKGLLKGNSADVIVADLPYGVVHGSRTGKGLARSPQELLEESLPGWVALLRPGGALGMSWNTHVAPREDALDLLEENGLEAVDYEGFEHRVDQGINRDILVARKV